MDRKGFKQYLIITADDFGYSEERDDGIVECFRHGAISNVSMITNGCSVVSAVKKALSAGLPMGLHLNLTEGSPVSKIPHKTLVGENGYMLGKQGFRDALQQRLIDLNEVRQEIQSQIDRFTEVTGSKPINVDGHQHVHIIPGICEIFAQVLQVNGVTLTRLPVEEDVVTPFLQKVVNQSNDAIQILKQYNLWAPRFTGLRTMGQSMTTKLLQSCINEVFRSKLGKGTPDDSSIVCELMTHPGYRTGNYGGCGNGPDTFSQSSDRNYEMQILLNLEMCQFYKVSNIKLISFKDLKLLSQYLNIYI